MNVELFKANFGGYLLAIIVLLLAYAAMGIWMPKYANAFALITLLGIAMFYLKDKIPTKD
jgi:hypothetical protein